MERDADDELVTTEPQLHSLGQAADDGDIDTSNVTPLRPRQPPR